MAVQFFWGGGCNCGHNVHRIHVSTVDPISPCCVGLQKTLTAMVAVIEQLGGAFGESGLLVLACVAVQLNRV